MKQRNIHWETHRNVHAKGQRTALNFLPWVKSIARTSSHFTTANSSLHWMKSTSFAFWDSMGRESKSLTGWILLESSCFRSVFHTVFQKLGVSIVMGYPQFSSILMGFSLTETIQLLGIPLWKPPWKPLENPWTSGKLSSAYLLHMVVEGGMGSMSRLGTGGLFG